MTSERYTNINNIFPEVKSDDINPESLVEVQMNYLRKGKLPESIKKLINKYVDSPDIVVNTITLANVKRRVENAFDEFPFSVLIEAFESQSWYKTLCVKSVCVVEKNVYINILYRLSFKCNFENFTSNIGLLSEFLKLDMSPNNYLADESLWGLDRSRIGVRYSDDAILIKYISECDIDIEEFNILKKDYYFRNLDRNYVLYKVMMVYAGLTTPGVSDKIRKTEEYKKLLRSDGIIEITTDNMRAIDHIFENTPEIYEFDQIIRKYEVNDFIGNNNYGLKFDTIGEYKLPLFLEGVLSVFPDNSGISKMETYYKIVVKMLKDILVKDAKIKENFQKMIKNIYGQDRAKEKFDLKNNCDDVIAFNLGFVFLNMASEMFSSKFIHKVGLNKFVTFSFFYPMRLLEISACRIIRTYLKEGGPMNVYVKVLLMRSEFVVKYIDFIISLIEERKSEVFKDLEDYMKINYPEENIETTVKLFDFGFEEKKAEYPSEILYDKEFVTSLLLLSEQFFSYIENPNILRFYSTLLIYKNTFHNSVIRFIYLKTREKSFFHLDTILLQRLIRVYTDKKYDENQEERFYLNSILINKVIGINRNSLKMVNSMVSDFDTNLTGILNTIVEIKEMFKKIKYLNQLLMQEKIEEDCISDDEEGSNLLNNETNSRLSRLLEHYDEEGIFNYAQRFYEQTQQNGTNSFDSFDSAYHYFRGESLRFKDPIRHKVYCKITINNQRVKFTENRLKFHIKAMHSYLSVLIDFTSINRKAFFNRNIFYRISNILNGALLNLLGPNRDNYKIKDPKKYNYNPKLILKEILELIIKLLLDNTKLIICSGLSSDLLTTGLKISRNKNLLTEYENQKLENIINVLQTNASSENDDNLDIPEEYLDPLTFEIMKHPVRITTSNVIVDKNTFNQIMLNDATDPFSRLPLTENSFEPCKALETEISEYLKAKSKSKKST